MKKRICFGFFVLLAGLSRAEVTFTPLFNNSAVLQCEMPVNVWGRSAPGAWADFPEPPVTLQNSAGLPAEPFLQSRNQK